MEVPDDLAEVFDAWMRQEYGDGDGQDSNPPIQTRHQLANPDFWFFAGSGLGIILIFTSFVPTNAFEPILFGALMLNAAGLVANLTREKQGLIIHVLNHHYAINLRLPRWLGFGLVRPDRPLVERVVW